jgi:tryptophan synthase beta chain
VNYVNILDDEALAAFSTMAKTEGILPAIETSHAIAYAMKAAAKRKKDDVIVVCLSGRGDKDVNEVARLTGQEM